VEGTEVKELCAVDRLWKTARDSETEEDKNCGSWTETEQCDVERLGEDGTSIRFSSIVVHCCKLQSVCNF
jgi:hypothetical protein